MYRLCHCLILYKIKPATRNKLALTNVINIDLWNTKLTYARSIRSRSKLVSVSMYTAELFKRP